MIENKKYPIYYNPYGDSADYTVYTNGPVVWIPHILRKSGSIMKIDILPGPRKILVYCVSLMTLAYGTLAANPFLSGGTPTVRQPSSSGILPGLDTGRLWGFHFSSAEQPGCLAYVGREGLFSKLKAKEHVISIIAFVHEMDSDAALCVI
ncbi:MAG: hypothetical protein ABIJ86_10970 [Spirochaetota bacterium]